MKKRKRRTGTRKRRRGLFIVFAALLLALSAFFWAPGLTREVKYRLYPRQYAEYVSYYAGKYGLDENLLYAVIYTESGFDAAASNEAGARGLMQITEITFDWIKGRIAPGEALAAEDLFDPETNIRFGSFYLAACLSRYEGHVPTAAAAYFSGWGTVDGLLQNEEYSSDGRTLLVFPYAGMAQYVRKIDKAYTMYQELYAS